MQKLLQKFKNYVSIITQQLETSCNFNSWGELGRSEQKILNNILEKMLDDLEWPTALTTLLNTLSNRRVVVLVDEYDTPTSYAVQYGYFAEVCRWPLNWVWHSFNPCCRPTSSSGRSSRHWSRGACFILAQQTSAWANIIEQWKCSWVFYRSPKQAGCLEWTTLQSAGFLIFLTAQIKLFW